MYHSPSSSAYVKNALIYTTAPSCAFIWWCFIRHIEAWKLYVVVKIGTLFWRKNIGYGAWKQRDEDVVWTENRRCMKKCRNLRTVVTHNVYGGGTVSQSRKWGEWNKMRNKTFCVFLRTISGTETRMQNTVYYYFWK